MTKSRVKRLFAIVLSFVLLSEVGSAQTLEEAIRRQAEEYRRKVTRFVNTSDATISMTAYGFRDNALSVGYIVDTPGTSFDVPYRLKKGYVYAFIGACDADCEGVDLTLYGPQVAETIVSKNPSIWLWVKEDGEYRIRATIPTCNAPIGCYVAIKVMSK
jgi:hypothetical protein